MRAPSGVREQKKRQTRDLLERRALELFERKGFDATTIDEIAEAALVSPRTFFRYFSSKEDVVFGSHSDELAWLRQLVASRPREEPPEIALAKALVKFGQIPEERQPELLARVKLIMANPSLLARRLLLHREWESGVAEELALRERVEGPTLELRILAATGVAALATATFIWGERGGPESPADLLRQALDRLISAN